MTNNLFNFLVFLFILTTLGVYTLDFISKANIIKQYNVNIIGIPK